MDTHSDPVSRTRRWGFRFVAIVAVLALAELFLQSAASVSPKVRWALLPPWRQNLPEELERVTVPVQLEDPRFGVRGNPEYHDHDDLGFHNPRVPEQADIVAIGDSHTYGVLLAQHKAWPAVVQEITGTRTYNMGIGGWGPVEYFMALDEALALEPETVLFGLYFGNDFFDCFRAVHLRGVETGLADPAARPAIERAETECPIMDQITGTYYAERSGANAEPIAAPRGVLGSARATVSKHCKLYAIIRLLKNACVPAEAMAGPDPENPEEVWQHALRWAANHEHDSSVLDLGRIRAVLTPPCRHVALNLDDPRIREGIAIGLKALTRSADRCRERGARPVVVLLPTKELVFDAVIPDRSAHPLLEHLIACETEVRHRVAIHLQSQGILVIDPLPNLRACLADPASDQPYPTWANGHPDPTGHRAIARTVVEALKTPQDASKL